MAGLPPPYRPIIGRTRIMQKFSFDTDIFKEGATYVAYLPALDISSCGATDDEARRNIRDAVRGFLAACAGNDRRNSGRSRSPVIPAYREISVFIINKRLAPSPLSTEPPPV